MNAPILESTYRKMVAADLDRVAAIEATLHASPWTHRNFVDSLDVGYHCWVVERESAIAGYGIVAVGAGEAHLLNLTIAPEWQRRGIGGELTAFLARVARDYGAAKIFLEVRPSNEAGRALYARAGFAEIGVRRGYYPAPQGREDAVVMELELQ